MLVEQLKYSYNNIDMNSQGISARAQPGCALWRLSGTAKTVWSSAECCSMEEPRMKRVWIVNGYHAEQTELDERHRLQ